MNSPNVIVITDSKHRTDLIPKQELENIQRKQTVGDRNCLQVSWIKQSIPPVGRGKSSSSSREGHNFFNIKKNL